MTNDKGYWSHKHDYPIEEVWNTYRVLAREIVLRLQAFKVLDKHGYPAIGMKDMRQWNATIQKMIDAFELLNYSSSYTEGENRIIEEGLELFCKYYRNLWD